MKVGIITRHAITNYGSLLQTIALQNVINDMGYECSIIDYIREDEDYHNYEKEIVKQKPFGKNFFLKYLYLLLRYPGSYIAGKKFEKERQIYLNLTNRFCNKIELESNLPDFDIYMTGSDQVWGPVMDKTVDTAYCLSFVNGKKVSYAASFGHIQLDEKAKEEFRRWLKLYTYISVREESAKKILDDMGIPCTQVLDPTLLVTANEWDRIAKPIRMSNYILIYQIHNDKRLSKYAERIAKERGKQLIRVSASSHQCFRNGKFIWCPPIGIFLSLIRNADCLVTDSFHGTAFAINYNINFVEVLPNNSTETRNMSILKLTGLTNKILGMSKNDPYDVPINYVEVNRIIETHRGISKKFLKLIIEE